MTQITVSIVTPSYNQGQFIDRTLRSVANQRSYDFEIEHVVFDGGSTDTTVDVLKSFAPAVRWVSQKDKGQTDAINQGLRATKGDIVCYLNSDDIFYPDAISTVVSFFNANPEIDVVYGMADHIDIDDRSFEAYPTEPWNLERLKDTCIICQPALFFRRKLINSYGLFDESLNYCMDYEYWLRLGIAGVRFAYIEKKLAGSRLYADNKTLGARVKVHKEINDMFKKKFGKASDRWLINYAHVVTEAKVNRQLHPKLFILALASVLFFSSLRWNKNISLALLRTCTQWAFSTISKS